MPDLTKNQPGKLTILYWQPTSITESPNANAYQKPLGLALLGQVLMVCPRDAQIPDKIRRRVTIIPINTPLRGHWYTRFGSIGKVLLACRSVTEARAIDLVATRVEIPSLLVGLLERGAAPAAGPGQSDARFHVLHPAGVPAIRAVR